MPTTMKAIQLHEFGGPEVLRYETVPVPELKPGEVLVRVHAVGINPPDWYLRDGYEHSQLPAEMRPSVPLPVIPGSDVSGVVEAVATDVQGFSVGDEVFGMLRFPSFGESAAYAEYVAAPASDVARKPAGIDHVQAAAAPMSGLTAWQFLIELGHDEPNPLQPERHRPVALDGKTVLSMVPQAAWGTSPCSWQNGRVRTLSRWHRVRMSRSCASSAPTNSSTTPRVVPRTSRTTSISFSIRSEVPPPVVSCHAQAWRRLVPGVSGLLRRRGGREAGRHGLDDPSTLERPAT